MAELVRTNNPGIISVIEGLLGGADIPYQVTDRNMSVLEGSISAIQVRILVRDDDEDEARELLTEAELGAWLRPVKGSARGARGHRGEGRRRGSGVRDGAVLVDGVDPAQG